MGRLGTIAVVASIILTIILAAALFLANPSQPNEAASTAKDYALITFQPSALVVKAEVAETPKELMTGLMNRSSLGKDEGMLFIFPDSAVRSFWMKNTLIPLDMIFVAENGTIARIQHAAPCTSDPCPTYSSEKQAKYVLEVNGNFTIDNAVKEGSRITIKILNAGKGI